MIVILARQSKFINELISSLNQKKIAYRFHHRVSKEAMAEVYDEKTRAALIDFNTGNLPDPVWRDILTCIGKRIPLVVFDDRAVHGVSHESDHDYPDYLFVREPQAQLIDEYFGNHLIRQNISKPNKPDVIPIYTADIPLRMLTQDGAVSFLSINGSKLRSIALEYGGETYEKLQDCFQNILYKLWGAPGSFRKGDILVRKSPQSNDYYMFLQKTRASSAVPAPGVTEKLANRVAFRIQTALWHELLKSKEDRLLPDCLKVIPDISVGYATAINNPCEEPEQILEAVLEKSFIVAKIQQKRMLDRQREVMQTLIQNEGILFPHFQGVFNLQAITLEKVEQVRRERSIKPLKADIIGFESLIRVRKERIEHFLHQDGLVYMDSQILRPDVLFQIANSTLISLELDQACLRQAMKTGHPLPGKLLINILPRNLYYISSIVPDLKADKPIIFEISESEGIQNFELIMKVSRKLKQMNMSIAADDFGKGYAGLERVLKIQPEIIKLDRSLIENIHKEKSKRSFVRGLVDAATESQSTVLAEGVELWEEAEVLKEMGVELIQGFLLHRPQPVEQILEDLELDAEGKSIVDTDHLNVA